MKMEKPENNIVLILCDYSWDIASELPEDGISRKI